MLNILRRVATEKKVAADLFRAVAEQAREPAFYAQLGVADSFDGRFDLVVLHGWLVLDRLKQDGLTDLGQRLIQQMVIAFEDGLRDQGAGDMSIGRRSKAMTSALFGRMKSYDAASDDAQMSEALIRNLFRDAPDRADCAGKIAAYIASSRKALSDVPVADGIVAFAPLASDAETKQRD